MMHSFLQFLTPVYQARARTVEHATVQALPSVVPVLKAFLGMTVQEMVRQTEFLVSFSDSTKMNRASGIRKWSFPN